jgi:hypothetical protein
MPTYDIDEARLTVPEGWHDRTVNTLEYPGREGGLRVIMSRQPHKGRALGVVVDDVLLEMRRRFAGFEIVSRDEVMVDLQPAIELRLRFKDGPEHLEQRVLWFLHGVQCVSLGVLSSGKTGDEADGIYAEIRKTMRRRSGDDETN